jgi:hypothetical protein
MGFFGDLGKALVGMPTAQNKQPSVPIASHSVLDANGYKIIPNISLNNIQSHRSSDQLIVTGWVVNDSDQQVRIDYCYLLKQKRQFNQVLAPGQSHQATLYQGPAPRNENEHSANFIYRLLTNGDSFQKTYTIRYHLESDGTRTIDELHEDGPVRDI